MYPLAPLNKLSKSRIMRICHFWAKNGLFVPLFKKPIIKPCSLHSCQSTFKKSKSDVNPLMQYLLLKKTKAYLAASIFDHNLRTIFFPHMQFLHNVKGP